MVKDKKPRRATIKARPLPSSEEVQQTIQKLYPPSRERIPLTVIMKLHNLGQRKTQLLLNTHTYVTQQIAQLLEHFQEDLGTIRSDGAIALVLSQPFSAPGPVRKLETAIRRASKDPKRDRDPEQRFSSRIREAICREVARLLVTWVQNICLPLLHEKVEQQKQAKISKASPMRKSAAAPVRKSARNRRISTDMRKIKLTVEEVQASWRSQLAAHKAAGECVIPFGRHKGTPLIEIGKREARWLLERLLSKKEINETLTFVEHLIEHGPDLESEAAYADHPYRIDDRYERALRANRLVERVLSLGGEPIILGRLKRDELERFCYELREMRDNGIALDTQLHALSESLKEAGRASEQSADFKLAFETFLYGKPDNYPTIKLPPSSDQLAEAQKAYKTRLKWFRPDHYRPHDMEKYANVEQEREAVERLLITGKALREEGYYPIPLIGAMKPGEYRDFALLVDKEHGNFYMAIKLQGQANKTPSIRKQGESGAQPDSSQPKLVYVNNPHLAFQRPPLASIELFPLTWGEQNEEARFMRQRVPMMREVIEHQRSICQTIPETAPPRSKKRKGKKKAVEQESTSVVQDVTQSEEAEEKKKGLKQETAPVASGRIVAKKEGEAWAFYIHLSVQFIPKAPAPEPTRVIGFHEHNQGYTFAVVDLDGKVTRDARGTMLLGDVPIPAHVIPKTEAAPYTDNYVFEVANTMVSCAGTAWMCIEDTSWEKEQPTLSRAENQALFRRPSQRIIDIATYKAQLAGLLRPITANDISPRYDCPFCHKRMSDDLPVVQWSRYIPCPHCTKKLPYQPMDTQWSCTFCEKTGAIKDGMLTYEELFRCPQCSAEPMAAHEGRAILVAQEGLRIIKRLVQGKKKSESDTTN